MKFGLPPKNRLLNLKMTHLNKNANLFLKQNLVFEPKFSFPHGVVSCSARTGIFSKKFSAGSFSSNPAENGNFFFSF